MTYFNNLGQGRVGWKSPSNGGGIDSDAQAFITAASITDSTQQSAINTLVTQLKTYGIWSKMKALYPFVGGTAAQHRFNLKDPRPVNEAFYLSFYGGGTHGPNGYLPNGNSYADTFLAPQATLSQNSTHVSYYSRTNNMLDGIDFGSATASFTNQLYSYIKAVDGKTYFRINRSGTAESNIAIADSRLFYMINRNSPTQEVLFTNTTKNTFNYNSTGLSNYSIFLGSTNLGGTPSIYGSKESAFASIGDGLTDTEASNFYTAVQTFQTTLGRQVGVPIVADTDAQAFLNAAVITDQTQATAINTLVTDLKTANIWTKMKALYPFVGGTAAQHRFNLKDPRTVNAAFYLDFFGGGTHSATGYQPNGNSYADTKLNVNNTLNGTNSHLSYYSRTTVIPGAGKDYYMMGAYDLPNSRYYAIDVYGANPNVYSSLGNFVNATDKTIANTKGLFLVKKESNNNQKVIINNTLIDTQTQLATLKPNYNIGLAAAINNSGVYGYSTFETAFASIGDGLTDAEATAFYNAVQTYQTTLGRQV